jgi:hypothetical protein
MLQGRSKFLTFMLFAGFIFLYVPMILLIIYSFNYSKLVPVWGGWSTRWYKELFESPEVWEAVSLSLQIAFINATFATVLGTLAGLAMVRFGRFRGRTIFGGMLVAPLVFEPRSAGQPISSFREMKKTSNERPVITAGITRGATSIPPKMVRPLKRPKRTIASPASVPSTVAKVALIKAIWRLRLTASQTSGDSNNSLYQRVDQPPHTGTSFE